MSSPDQSSAEERGYSRGKVCVWPGGILWIGTGGDSTGTVHAHHALQLSFGDEQGLPFRQGNAGDWTNYLGCLIPANLPHAIDASRRHFAIIFVDPETPAGRSLRAKADAAGADGRIVRLDDDASLAAADLLRRTWLETPDCAPLEAAAREVVRRFAGTVPPPVTGDPRVLGAIELIRARLDGRVTLTEIARELHVSPSRLRHLFVEEVGLPFRTYVLWQRLQRVIQQLGGGNLTHAALSAGFADAAHMTRTFRRMVGFAPSSLRAG